MLMSLYQMVDATLSFLQGAIELILKKICTLENKIEFLSYFR